MEPIFALIPAHIRAVIFDHDGTLVDSEPAHHQCWQACLSNYNQQLSLDDYIRNLSGIPSIKSAEWLIQKFNLATTANELLAQKSMLLAQLTQNQPPPLLTNVLSVLNLLQQRDLALGVASGASADEVKRSITNHNLEPYFDVICTKDDVDNNKPAPDVYLLAAAKLGVLPQNCLAIEDSDNGQTAALRAGMICFRLGPPELAKTAPPNCTIIPNLGSIR